MIALQARAAAIFARLGVSGLITLVLLFACVALHLNTYADIQLKGPFGITFDYEGWKPKAERLQRTIDTFDEAQKEARKLAEAAVRAKEQEWKDKADVADDRNELAQDSALDAAERYIAANRMCPADRGSTRSASPAAAPDRASVPAGVPADRLVAVSDDDVRACSAATAYALSAHQWAVSVRPKGE